MELDRRKRESRLSYYRPIPRQAEFHRLGATENERLYMAANQVGKTVAGGSEWAVHLTGRYPEWWNGAVFERPVRFWVGGVTGESTRDNPQRILVGQPEIPELWGTGTVPLDALEDVTPGRGIPNGLDSLVVRFGGGGDVQQGFSTLLFKSYEKGRAKWQGDTVDGVWFDEEPPMPVYSEGRTRTNNGQIGVFTMLTATPLLGMSEVVRLFLSEDEAKQMKRDAA